MDSQVAAKVVGNFVPQTTALVKIQKCCCLESKWQQSHIKHVLTARPTRTTWMMVEFHTSFFTPQRKSGKMLPERRDGSSHCATGQPTCANRKPLIIPFVGVGVARMCWMYVTPMRNHQWRLVWCHCREASLRFVMKGCTKYVCHCTLGEINQTNVFRAIWKAIIRHT